MNPLAAMCHAAAAALSALEAFAGQTADARTDRRPGPALGDPVLALITATSSLVGRVAAYMPQPTGLRYAAPITSAPSGIPGADLRRVVAGTFAISVGSSLRFWQALAELHGRKAALLQSYARRDRSGLPGPEAERLLIDELRGLFRELGEAALSEAARLQSELEQISGSIGYEAESSAAYRRRWRAKE